MLFNYLKLSLRLLMRNPFFTFVNVAGLSVGFAVFFILWQYSQNELNSDKQWANWERIVRCGYIWKWTDDGVTWSQSQFGLHWPEIVKRVSEDFQEIEDMTRIFRQENFAPEHIPDHGKEIFLTRIDERGKLISFKETALAYADPNLFTFFSIPLLEGNRDKLLDEANSVVLSQKAAKKYFGDVSPLNQILLINNHIALKVTGVFKDLPENTHLEFEGVISTRTIERNINLSRFTLGGGHTYFRLNAETDWKHLEKKINSLGYYYWDERIPEIKRDIRKAEFYLQPLNEVPFVNYRWDYFKPKSAYFLYALSWVGVFVLIVAWVNYVQLSVSFYMKRLREIGVRKTNGARLLDFMSQFLLESFIVNFISILLALTLIQLVKGPLQLWFGFYFLPLKELPVSTLIILSGAFSCGVLLSVASPLIFVLKKDLNSLFSKTTRQAGGWTIANQLVAVQFSAAIVLIIWVFSVYRQVDYVEKADYGIKRDQVVLLDLPQVRSASFNADLNVLIQEMNSMEGVQGITYFTTITGDADNNMICIKLTADVNHTCVDTNGGINENFIPFFDVKLLAGRNFSDNMPSDSASVIVSIRAIQRVGIQKPEDAIGKEILVNTGDWTNWNFQYAEIIGVVEDYLGGKTSMIVNQGMGSGHGGIILTYKDKLLQASKPQKLAVRIHLDRFEHIHEGMEKMYSEIFPGQLFRFYFLDDQIARFYDGEKIARNQLLLFTIIAIGISCLGLLGMISSKVVEKTKEIGIRKVLGARLYHIAHILLNTTLRQVIIATIVGMPVAYYLIQQYLEKFSERIVLQWWHYALPVFILIVIMIATIASVLWKAATSNPVEALKYE